jgi:DNA-directed RNA polymerase specialized sigma24 family protein
MDIPEAGETRLFSQEHAYALRRCMLRLAGDHIAVLVGDAVAQLSAEHRAVVHRSYYEGRTTQQIAADLEIAERAVKSRLHEALRVLRQTLEEMGVTA